ncbi:MAG: helix-turn-helix transcriptional regulator [Chloroflexaceae bacterium]|nr:helix-turn-helix transcriptional regulator [Chloroflexaceae bacterium]
MDAAGSDSVLQEQPMPLAVMLFSAAMHQELALSKYAEQLDISPLSLRQFINGKTQRPREKTLAILSEALGISVSEVRHRNALLPNAAPPFAEWLQAQMENGFSRARLNRETGISDGALRNYLDGQTLPDTDQAQRLAQAFQVDPLELAQILVANHMVMQSGITLPEPLAPPALNGSAELPASHVERHPVHANVPPFSPFPQNDYSEYNEHVVDRVVPEYERADPAEERRLLTLWRRLHPQGRRATLNYIAGLLAEF